MIVLSTRTIQEIQAAVANAVAEAISETGKVATAKTIASANAEVIRDSGVTTIQGYAEGGAKWIVQGKPAGTKMPVVKGPNGWDLVQPLAEWKDALNIQIPDFVLARTIADNPRAPVDLGAVALRIYKERYASDLERKILEDMTAQQLAEIDKILQL